MLKTDSLMKRIRTKLGSALLRLGGRLDPTASNAQLKRALRAAGASDEEIDEIVSAAKSETGSAASSIASPAAISPATSTAPSVKSPLPHVGQPAVSADASPRPAASHEALSSEGLAAAELEPTLNTLNHLHPVNTPSSAASSASAPIATAPLAGVSKPSAASPGSEFAGKSLDELRTALAAAGSPVTRGRIAAELARRRQAEPSHVSGEGYDGSYDAARAEGRPPVVPLKAGQGTRLAVSDVAFARASDDAPSRAKALAALAAEVGVQHATGEIPPIIPKSRPVEDAARLRAILQDSRIEMDRLDALEKFQASFVLDSRTIPFLSRAEALLALAREPHPGVRWRLYNHVADNRTGRGTVLGMCFGRLDVMKEIPDQDVQSGETGIVFEANG